MKYQDGSSLWPKRLPKPTWLRVKLPSGETHARVRKLIQNSSLHTVCEEAKCPNLAECWGRGTATFLILGNRCTRQCRFCSVKPMERIRTDPHGHIGFLSRFSVANPAHGHRIADDSATEAQELAAAVVAMSLRHAVVTSVSRDDLLDGGASAFARVVELVHAEVPGCTVEVLVPDFGGAVEAISAVVHSRPEVFGHNVETVPRLYASVRPQALYQRTLSVLAIARKLDPAIVTKSGFMVGLGEDLKEIREIMEDLRGVDCDVLTIGQYLRPGKEQLPVVRYYAPEEFAAMKELASELGFRWVESGPLVRSSYHAEAQAIALIPGRKESCRRTT